MNLSLNLNSFDFPTHLKPFMGIFWDITHPYKLFASKYIFFLYQGFLHRHWRFTGQQGKGRDHLLFHCTTSTLLRTLRLLLATMHVRRLSHIFNCNACVYQTATRWDLPPYRVTIWVIVWWCNVCLFTLWIDTRFCYSNLTLKTGGFELASTIILVLQANRLTKFSISKI